jgi:hypothetical protein
MNDELRAEYDKWIRHYVARSPVVRFESGEVRIKLILTAIGGDEETPSAGCSGGTTANICWPL